MYNEFGSNPSGMDVLKSYEIEDTSISNDLLVLFFYSMVSSYIPKNTKPADKILATSSKINDPCLFQVIQLVCVTKLILGNATVIGQKQKES